VIALPDWLTPLPDAETMRGVDRWAIEERGLAGVELMERAGVGVARAVEGLVAEGPVAVVCGKGNNGGDGLVVARLLREAGREVSVVSTASPSDFSGDALLNLKRLPGPGPVHLEGTPWSDSEEAGDPFGEDPVGRAMVIVDALLGTGFEGEPRGVVAQAIAAINRAQGQVVSVDVPSGVDASSGMVAGEAVRAAITVSFHAAKPGLWIRPGKAHGGEVVVVDIGIPRGAPMAATVGLIEPSILRGLPRRGADGTKFVSGHVLVAGGSRGLTGAPAMAARASMRAGAGYVTGCLPASLQAIVAGGGTPELMTVALPEREGALTVEGVAQVLEAGGRGGALALGPGLGRSEGAFAFARRLAQEAEIPMVLDADGLNAHGGRLQELRARRAQTVLTPHAGELGRLLEIDSAEVEGARLEHVRRAAEMAGAVVLLKGDDTLIADPEGIVAVSPGGSPALATAGTGDVLTGVIAALLAQGLEPFRAAATGVWLHAEAGRIAARRLGAAEGVIASDVIEALPRARSGSGAREGEQEGGGDG
jgi:ADP-dependent NAD(P)H-hydrate dehydratase / NAD(P)H-hydrate epimerase